MKLSKLLCGASYLPVDPFEYSFTKNYLNHNIIKLNVNLKSQNVASLSNDIGKVKYLQHLSIINGELSEFLDESGNLEKLKSLKLDNLGLQEINPSNSNLEKLSSISFQNNKLKNLPNELYLQKSVQNINLFANLFTEIPSELLNMPKLNFLDISDN